MISFDVKEPDVAFDTTKSKENISIEEVNVNRKEVNAMRQIENVPTDVQRLKERLKVYLDGAKSDDIVSNFITLLENCSTNEEIFKLI